MTTTIVGIGHIGSGIARDLAYSDENVIVVARNLDTATAFAASLGDSVSAATLEDAVAQSDVIVLAVYLDAAASLLRELGDQLTGKTVIDPTNPIGVDASGNLIRTLPDTESAADILSALLPDGAHFAKSFGSLPAAALTSHSNATPERVAMFYAPSDDTAAAAAERVINAAGFEPIRLDGPDAALRIEFRGDLSSRILPASRARDLV